MKSTLFVLRIAFNWLLVAMLGAMVWTTITGHAPGRAYGVALFFTLIIVIARASAHVRRVGFISDRIDAATLASRHRRHIEIPFPAEEAFTMVDAAVRELPFVEVVESVRDSLQIHARVRRMHPYVSSRQGRRPHGSRRNLVRATVAPSTTTGSVTLNCEPEGGALADWFLVDDGSNFENAEAITRAIARRVSERRKGEEARAQEAAAGKELAVAKLNLLHAQVEPHFLYNTLASAQILTRSDPARADRMLGHLITYLRRSMPQAEEAMSTLGDELERALAYLEILRIRMGDRLAVQVQVPEALKSAGMPPMMLQTLVENAIKHGLEPVPGGGTVWILARDSDGRVVVTVADDGRGFSEDGGGTGIGLKNIRERLRLAYGDAASFSIVANFPRGVAATITLPRPSPQPSPRPSPMGEGELSPSPRAPQSGDGPGPNSNA